MRKTLVPNLLTKVFALSAFFLLTSSFAFAKTQTSLSYTAGIRGDRFSPYGLSVDNIFFFGEPQSGQTNYGFDVKVGTWIYDLDDYKDNDMLHWGVLVFSWACCCCSF